MRRAGVGGQGGRLCRDRRRPPWRPAAVGRCRRGPGSDYVGRRLLSGPRRRPVPGKAGSRGDPVAIHRAAAEPMDAGL